LLIFFLKIFAKNQIVNNKIGMDTEMNISLLKKKLSKLIGFIKVLINPIR
jgi:hypothetical protein